MEIQTLQIGSYVGILTPTEAFSLNSRFIDFKFDGKSTKSLFLLLKLSK